MFTPAQVRERSKAGFNRWYDDNRETYNALRRKRYAASKGARMAAQLRAADYRMRGASIERSLTRQLNGKVVGVLSTGQVAKLANRSPQMLRNWEKQGLIPESVFSDKHRLYTYKQARMIATLGRVITRNGGWDNTKTKNYIEKIKQRW